MASMAWRIHQSFCIKGAFKRVPIKPHSDTTTFSGIRVRFSAQHVPKKPNQIFTFQMFSNIFKKQLRIVKQKTYLSQSFSKELQQNTQNTPIRVRFRNVKDPP
jgi:hypothetical protein